MRFFTHLHPASFGHGGEPSQRLERTEEQAAGLAFPHARDIQAIVQAISQVDIRAPRRPKQHAVALGEAGGGMGSRVISA